MTFFLPAPSSLLKLSILCLYTKTHPFQESESTLRLVCTTWNNRKSHNLTQRSISSWRFRCSNPRSFLSCLFSTFTRERFVPNKRKCASPMLHVTPTWNHRNSLNLTQSSILKWRFRWSSRRIFLTSLTTWDNHICGFDDNSSKQQDIFNFLYLLQRSSIQSSWSVLRQQHWIIYERNGIIIIVLTDQTFTVEWRFPQRFCHC